MPHKYINYDLETFPLQIKTNSEKGSGEKVEVYFKSSEGSYSGGIQLFFTSPSQYRLTWCTLIANFQTDLPSETDKVWTVIFSRASGEIRLVIICNNVEVVNLVISNTTCNDSEVSHLNGLWSKGVKRINFHSAHGDTASDYYRPGK